jgi:hypothetical protein
MEAERLMVKCFVPGCAEAIARSAIATRGGRLYGGAWACSDEHKNEAVRTLVNTYGITAGRVIQGRG